MSKSEWVRSLKVEEEYNEFMHNPTDEASYTMEECERCGRLVPLNFILVFDFGCKFCEAESGEGE